MGKYLLYALFVVGASSLLNWMQLGRGVYAGSGGGYYGGPYYGGGSTSGGGHK